MRLGYGLLSTIVRITAVFPRMAVSVLSKSVWAIRRLGAKRGICLMNRRWTSVQTSLKWPAQRLGANGRTANNAQVGRIGYKLKRPHRRQIAMRPNQQITHGTAAARDLPPRLRSRGTRRVPRCGDRSTDRACPARRDRGDQGDPNRISHDRACRDPSTGRARNTREGRLPKSYRPSKASDPCRSPVRS
jgi:hypothetical protein